MSPILKGAVVASVFLVLSVLLFLSVDEDIRREAPPPVGYGLLSRFESEGVPDFEAPLVKQGVPTGANMKLSDYRGKIIILSFWATWCAPCIEEFPSMVQLIEKFNGEVVMIGVSADQRPADIESFLKTYKVDSRFFVNLWDPSTGIATKYGTEKIPENYIIGRDLKLIRKVTTVRDWFAPDVVAYFEALVAGNLASPPPADQAKQ